MMSDNPPQRNRIETNNPREVAYLATLISIREEIFVTEIMERWREEKLPSSQDFNFAREIAYGTVRMKLTLDYIAEKLSDTQKLKLKLREKVLLRTAIYQFYFMDRVPPYAIVNETVEIGKKHCHETFIGFLNASLRRLSDEKPELPKGETVPEMSIRFSYPQYFVQELVNNYGLEKSVAIFKAGNHPSLTMFRIRPQAEKVENGNGIERIAGVIAQIAVLKDPSYLSKIADSPDYYIQNATPALLIEILAQDVALPKRILDLCAAPGGKLLAVHDMFPDAALFANDVSSKKIQILSENSAKYGIRPTITCSKGEEYKADAPFDLVILDVPCSNSGVLNKRPEARWRISQKNLEQLEQLQLDLLKKASSLISENGEVWYMTCSILKRENSRLVNKACGLFNLEVRTEETILPNLDGWDGGYACALRNKKESK